VNFIDSKESKNERINGREERHKESKKKKKKSGWIACS
jgi:hypothetical protein